MSTSQTISFWHEKPDLRGIENLVAGTLPQAVEYAGGICEAQGYSYDLVLPENAKSELCISQTDRVTPYAEHASPHLPHIGLAHPLILGFADRVLEAAPIDIIELIPYKETPPQRVVEKLSSRLAFRPSKIELVKHDRIRRVWTHSVYWLGFEAVDLGNRLKHFLQDDNGRFLGDPEDYLRRLHLRSGEFNVDCHSRIPGDLAAPFESRISEQVFEAEFKSEISRVQNEELSKAVTYYERLEADLRIRIDQETERDGKPAAIEALELKIERVRMERDVRIGNIRERFRAQFRIQPVGARILILPTYRCTLKPTNSSEASISIDYCPVLREFLLPLCPACDQTSRDMVLKGNQYLCPKCC